MEFECDYFEKLKINETFWLNAELFQKIDKDTAVRVEGFYKYDKDIKKLIKDKVEVL